MILFISLVVFLVVWRIWLSKPKNIGKMGERRVARMLDSLSKEYITLNDVLLHTQYGTTQIDHIVVSPYGIFIVETKNYKGWIFGHPNSEEWKQSLLGKRRGWRWSSKQYKFRNPIRQNLAHCRAVRDIIKSVGDFTIIPIVAFSDRANLKIAPSNHIVINWCDLNAVISSHRTSCILLDDIQRIVTLLSNENITIEGSREQHTRQVQVIQQNRNIAMVANRRCPKCGGTLVKRKGKYGSFLGCLNYPNCSYTQKD